MVKLQIYAISPNIHKKTFPNSRSCAGMFELLVSDSELDYSNRVGSKRAPL